MKYVYQVLKKFECRCIHLGLDTLTHTTTWRREMLCRHRAVHANACWLAMGVWT